MFGSILQQVVAGISDLFMSKIIELITGLFTGLLG